MSGNDDNFTEFLGRLCLRVGQLRTCDTFHNAGWYDRAGDKIGWGDLSYRDVEGIPLRLSPGEVVYILPEYKSFWDLRDTGRDESCPGLDWIWDYASAVLMSSGVKIISDGKDAVVEDKKWEGGVEVTFWPREHFKSFDWAFRPR